MLWLTTRHKALQQHAWRWLAALGSPQYTIQSLQTHFQDYDHVSTAFSSRSNQYWGTCLPSHHLLHTVPPHHIDSQSLNPKPTHHSASTRYPRGGIPRGPADTDEHPGAPVHPDEGHLPAQWRTERFPCLTQLHHARKKIKGDRLSKNAIPVLSNVLTSRALLLEMRDMNAHQLLQVVCACSWICESPPLKEAAIRIMGLAVQQLCSNTPVSTSYATTPPHMDGPSPMHARAAGMGSTDMMHATTAYRRTGGAPGHAGGTVVEKQQGLAVYRLSRNELVTLLQAFAAVKQTIALPYLKGIHDAMFIKSDTLLKRQAMVVMWVLQRVQQKPYTIPNITPVQKRIIELRDQLSENELAMFISVLAENMSLPGFSLPPEEKEALAYSVLTQLPLMSPRSLTAVMFAFSKMGWPSQLDYDHHWHLISNSLAHCSTTDLSYLARAIHIQGAWPPYIQPEVFVQALNRAIGMGMVPQVQSLLNGLKVLSTLPQLGIHFDALATLLNTVCAQALAGERTTTPAVVIAQVLDLLCKLGCVPKHLDVALCLNACLIRAEKLDLSILVRVLTYLSQTPMVGQLHLKVAYALERSMRDQWGHLHMGAVYNVLRFFKQHNIMISEEARAKLQDMVEYECGRVEAGQEERVNRLSMLLWLIGPFNILDDHHEQFARLLYVFTSRPHTWNEKSVYAVLSRCAEANHRPDPDTTKRLFDFLCSCIDDLSDVHLHGLVKMAGQLGPPAQFESHVLMEVMQKLLTSDHAFMGVRGKASALYYCLMQCFEDPLLLQQLHTLAHPWYQRLVSSVQNGSVTLEPSVHRRLYYVSQSIGALLPEAPILLPGTCLPRGEDPVPIMPSACVLQSWAKQHPRVVDAEANIPLLDGVMYVDVLLHLDNGARLVLHIAKRSNSYKGHKGPHEGASSWDKVSRSLEGSRAFDDCDSGDAWPRSYVSTERLPTLAMRLREATLRAAGFMVASVQWSRAIGVPSSLSCTEGAKVAFMKLLDGVMQEAEWGK